jgi:cytochrome c
MWKVAATIVLGIIIVSPENEPPVVKITAPRSSDVYQWNSQMRYAITVSDKEDGETKFDEIAVNEVLLEVNFVKDTSAKFTFKSDRAPLQAMMKSNCLTCHSFRSKLIGPSFADISAKYTSAAAEVTTLVKRVRDGSSGVWGSIVMPSHPELSPEETRKMVEWILDFKKHNTDYYIGTEGAIRLSKPAGATGKSGIQLTASYLDHDNKSGESRIIIPAKD